MNGIAAVNNLLMTIVFKYKTFNGLYLFYKKYK